MTFDSFECNSAHIMNTYKPTVYIKITATTDKITPTCLNPRPPYYSL